MARNDEIPRSGVYVGNGKQTEFPFEFDPIEARYVKVVVNNVEVSKDQFSVIIGATRSKVVMSTPPSVGARLVILGDIPFTQEIKLTNGTAFYPEELERGLDLAAARDQQLNERIDRCVQVPETSSGEATPAALLDALSDSVESAREYSVAAEQASYKAAEASYGTLEFRVPQMPTGSLLTLRVELAEEEDFSGSVFSASSDTPPSVFSMQDPETGEFAAAPTEGFSGTDVGKLVIFPMAAMTSVERGKSYFSRWRWSDGTSYTPWDGALVVVPPEDSGTPSPEDPGLALADVPSTIVGCQISVDGADVEVSTGYCQDEAGNALIRVESTITTPVSGLAKSREYGVYLIGGVGVNPAVVLSPGTVEYDVPWESPQMFSANYPAGYLASASSEYPELMGNAPQQIRFAAWRAFDRNETPAEIGDAVWQSKNNEALPQWVALEFDRPKKITSVYVRRRNVAPLAKEIEFYSKDAEGNWTKITAAGTLVLPDQANGSGSVTFSEVLCYGIQCRVLSNQVTSTRTALAEVRLYGLDSRVDDPTPTDIPEGYSYFRRIGAVSTDSTGALLPESVKNAGIQRFSAYQGRVWVSEPIYPRPGTLTDVTHGLNLDPRYCRADAIAVCVSPEWGYSVGDVAINLRGGDHHIAPAAGKTKVTFRQNGALYAQQGTGLPTQFGSVALTASRWVLYVRIWY